MPEPTKTRVTSITVSVAAQVWISQYRSFKPHASVTVAVGDTDNPSDAIELGIKELRPVYLSALRLEIDLVNETNEAMGPAASTDDLIIFVERELQDVARDPSFRIEEERSTEVREEGNNQSVQANNPSAGKSGTDHFGNPNPKPRGKSITTGNR